MVAEFINRLLSVEQYSFSLEELLRESNKSKNAIRQELAYLIKRQQVINLRKGFYLILTPRYSSFGKLPINLYVDKLFNYLGRGYYLGFYSAAKIYGASHQQAQRDYIMSEPPKLLDIQKSAINIRFLTTSAWPKKNIVSRRSDAGSYSVSSPALTLVDLVHYQNKLGGLNRMLSTIEELSEVVDHQDMEDLLGWYGNKATLQRLGFLIDELNPESFLVNVLFQHLQRQKIHPILLPPNTREKPGAVDKKWKVDTNLKLESDL